MSARGRLGSKTTVSPIPVAVSKGTGGAGDSGLRSGRLWQWAVAVAMRAGRRYYRRNRRRLDRRLGRCQMGDDLSVSAERSTVL